MNGTLDESVDLLRRTPNVLRALPAWLDHLAQALAAPAGSHDEHVGPCLGILLRRDEPSAVPG